MSKMIAVSDLSSIESRVAGWHTGCTRINQIFAEGKDTYKDFATEVYHVPYLEVDKKQRHFAKPAVLGSCYGLGAGGLGAYAEGYGVEMDTEEAQRITALYRETYPEIPAAWRWLSDSFMAVIEHQVLEAVGCGVRIFRDTNFLFMELPSGRRIAYYQPRVEMKVPPWEQKKVEESETHKADLIAMAENREDYDDALATAIYIPTTIPNVTYMGMNQYTRKWTRQSTHGGKILENICQAVARDILGWQMLEVENNRPNMDIILHVHDEMGALVDENTAAESLIELEGIMSTTPHWAPGLLLGAEGFITKRYRKD